MHELLLIRHGEVEPHWKKLCYGAMDVPLSASGVIASRALAQQIAWSDIPTVVFHSGLSRTQALAHFIAERSRDIAIVCDQRLRERNYGQWQGKSWDDAYASDPDNFHHLIHQPDTYRPPDGETTTEMQQRIVDWYQTISTSESRIIAISHSGPIAALAGYLMGAPAHQWQPWMLGYLETMVIRNGFPCRGQIQE